MCQSINSFGSVENRKAVVVVGGGGGGGGRRRSEGSHLSQYGADLLWCEWGEWWWSVHSWWGFLVYNSRGKLFQGVYSAMLHTHTLVIFLNKYRIRANKTALWIKRHFLAPQVHFLGKILNILPLWGNNLNIPPAWDPHIFIERQCFIYVDTVSFVLQDLGLVWPWLVRFSE